MSLNSLFQVALEEEKERSRTLAAELLGLTGSNASPKSGFGSLLLGLTGSNRGNGPGSTGMGGSAAGAADSPIVFQSCLSSPTNAPESRRVSSAADNTHDRLLSSLRERLSGMVEVSASIMGLSSDASVLEQRGRALLRE